MAEEGKEIEISKSEWHSHRQLLINRECEQSAALEKNLLTLSSGAIGLSALFFFNLIEKSAAWSVCFLVLSWFCFSATIVSTLFSFGVGRAAYARRLEEWDNIYESRRYDPACLKDTPYETCGKWLIRAAMGSFVLGMFLFMVYAIGNL